MTLGEALDEWQSVSRRRGCVSATDWLCQRVDGFYPQRLTRYTKEGEAYQHMVATNGVISIDLVPHRDGPK